ncbi:MAG TPA: alpha/beta hydrolase [Thermoanaerobaculia bacterium]|nr:alpha/beta hydrolase [Thermoanaerobaculia bacterium]
MLENRQARAGRKIDIKVVVLPAQGSSPAPDPLFALAGGPGESSTAAARIFAQLLEGVRRDRDVILVDLRGTGGSNPLHCPLPGSDDDPQGYLGDLLPIEAIRDCRKRLNADLTRYTTLDAVADLEEVRAALGYERINLYGVSYGSRAVLVYLRSHPGRVRSAILHGAVPTDMKVPLHYAEDAQRSLDLLLAACEADAACRAAYPGLRAKLAAVEKRLAAAPVDVEIEDPRTKRRVRLRIPLPLFREELRWRLYGEGENVVPSYIERAHEGDFSALAASLLRQRRALAAGALSLGTLLSVTCAEDVPFIDAAEARRRAQGSFLGTDRVDQQVRACSVWPRGKLPSGYHEPVRSEVPVLLISGERDPVTPPRWGEQVARHLPNSRHVVFRGGSHSGRSPCVRQILSDFVGRGTAGGLDDSCAEQAPPVAFALPAAKPAASETPAAGAALSSGPEGLWEGVIFIQRGWLEVELLVELMQGGAAGWAGSVDLPSQGLQYVPLSQVAVDRRKVSFEIHRPAEGAMAAIDARFEGALSEDGRTISGKFLEEGKTFDFALQRIGEAGVERPIPVHPDLRLLADRGEELKALFNQEQDKLRLVLLLSPT